MGGREFINCRRGRFKFYTYGKRDGGWEGGSLSTVEGGDSSSTHTANGMGGGGGVYQL